MKAPNKIEMDPCTFSDIGLFDIDEEEVQYVRVDEVLKLLNEEDPPIDCPAMFESGAFAGRTLLRNELKKKINEL